MLFKLLLSLVVLSITSTTSAATYVHIQLMKKGVIVSSATLRFSPQDPVQGEFKAQQEIPYTVNGVQTLVKIGLHVKATYSNNVVSYDLTLTSMPTTNKVKKDITPVVRGTTLLGDIKVITSASLPVKDSPDFDKVVFSVRHA